MKDKIKVITIGDSLALPRPEIKYEDTWVRLLKEEFIEYDIIDKSQRSATTDILNSNGSFNNINGADYLEFYKPDFVIIHLGICDCAPRLFSKSSIELRILNRLPSYIKTHYINLIKKYRTRSDKRAYVVPNQFRSNLEIYINRAKDIGVKKVFIVNIMRAGNKFLKSTPEVQKSIDRYNQIIGDIGNKNSNVGIINDLDKYCDPDLITLEDGYHFNTDGHKFMFEKLRIALSQQ